jgi:hypothetical protein
MALYLDPTGKTTYGIGICARCSRKMFLQELMPDPNYPGLMVCEEDLDDYDPYRLAPRVPDQVILPFNRPDTSLVTDPEGIITQDEDYFLITTAGEGYLIP